MRKLGGMLVVAAAVAALIPQASRAQVAVPAPSAQGADSSIRAAQAQMRSAAERLDATALYARVLDTETPPIIENGSLAVTRAAALARTAQGFQGVMSLRYAYTREQITMLSPTAALWVAEGTSTAMLADGRRVDNTFAETVVFVLRDGRWMVLHAHRSTPNR